MLETMDRKQCTIWEAADMLEDMREKAGTWKLLVQTDPVAKFRGDGKLRTPYMIRWKDVEFVQTALSIIKTVRPCEPIQVI